jgi:hypothetical protein
MRKTVVTERFHPLALGLLGFLASPAALAAIMVTLDFEGLPDLYYEDAGDQNLGNAYAARPGGPVFGPDATLLGVGRWLNDAEYPPASGETVLYTGFENFIRVDFTTAPVSMVSTYFRSGTDIFLFAFDAADNLLGQAFSSPNTAPDPAGYLTVNTAGFDIRYVVIEGAPNFFVLDDFTYTAIPEPAAGAGAVGLALAGLARWRRRR